MDSRPSGEELVFIDIVPDEHMRDSTCSHRPPPQRLFDHSSYRRVERQVIDRRKAGVSNSCIQLVLHRLKPQWVVHHGKHERHQRRGSCLNPRPVRRPDEDGPFSFRHAGILLLLRECVHERSWGRLDSFLPTDYILQLFEEGPCLGAMGKQMSLEWRQNGGDAQQSREEVNKVRAWQHGFLQDIEQLQGLFDIGHFPLSERACRIPVGTLSLQHSAQTRAHTQLVSGSSPTQGFHFRDHMSQCERRKSSPSQNSDA